MLVLHILALVAIWGIARFGRRDDRPFFYVLLFSTAYYGLGGYSYWVIFQHSVFAGRDWDESLLDEASILISLTAVALAAVVFILGRMSRMADVGVAVPVLGPRTRAQVPTVFWLMLGVGVAASLFVLSKGSVSTDAGDVRMRSPIFLIAYQFSDIIIAAALYRLAVRGFDRLTIVTILYFAVYATMVGFRYKIALIGVPMIMYLAFSSGPAGRKYIVTGAAALGAVALFSAMTLFRQKFGSLDVHRTLREPFQEIIYGFFAETNIIFGLSTIIRANVDQGIIHPVQPIADALMELLPRFLFPSRSTGEYLRPMQLAFLSDQGIASGTAYPWIGEFLIMFGWLGTVAAPVLLGTVYIWVKGRLKSLSSTPRQWIVGIFLLATLLGYYHFSRGYLPQILKSYLFVLVPFLILCASERWSFVTRSLRSRDQGKRRNPRILYK